jgi:ankyrin repeat protein
MPVENQESKGNRKKRNTKTDVSSSVTSSPPPFALRADAPEFVPNFASEENSRSGRHLFINKKNSKPQASKCDSRRRKRGDSIGRQKEQNRRPQQLSQRHDTKQKNGSTNAAKTRKKNGGLRVSNQHSDFKERFPQNPTVAGKDPGAVLSLSTFPVLCPTASPNTPSVSSPWIQAPKIIDDTQDESLGDNVGTNQERLNWVDGLEQLTSFSSPTSKIMKFGDASVVTLTSEEHSTNEKKKDIRSPVALPEESGGLVSNDTVASCNTSTVTNATLTLNRRIKVNMTRLRDRWWDALAQQKQLSAFRKELRKALETRRIDPVVIRNETGCGDANSNKTQRDEKVRNVKHGFTEVECKDARTQSFASICADDALQVVVERGDEVASARLFSLEYGSDSFGRFVERGTEIAVETNKPQLLKTILKSRDGMSAEDASFRLRCFIKAVNLGHEECVAVFLSNQHRGEKFLAHVDEKGNNVLHSCVQGRGDETLLKLLLEHIPGSNKGKKQQQFSKLLLSKNDDALTPLHEACRCKRLDFVEVFLGMCSTSLLAKLLRTEDADSQTPLLTAIANDAPDVVLGLIMFRGNHLPASRKTIFSGGKNRSHTIDKFQSNQNCPLVWAGKMGNIAMVDLLLQFESQSGSIYQVTEALYHLLQSNVSTESKLEACEVLLSAAANPFEELTSTDDQDSETCVGVAVSIKSPSIVQSLVSVGKTLLRHRQIARRRDPVLRQQPESFFRTIESKEDSEMKKATTRALLRSLLCAFQTQIPVYFFIAEVLYANGVALDRADISRLQHAMNGKELDFESIMRMDQYLIATYDYTPLLASQEDLKPNLNALDFDRTQLSLKSRLLLGMDWMEQENKCSCVWLSEKLSSRCRFLRFCDNEVLLISEDGSRFPVHESIVAPKSGKLESAIRFQRMNTVDVLDEKRLELKVPIAATHLQAMIQHFYHGSMFMWPSFSQNEMSRFLLELFTVAEEFLCQDLMKEIEMRLLHSSPQSCFCWFCCHAVRNHPDDASMAQCLYCVDGESTLLTADVVFDVMGLTEFFETPSYNIHKLPQSIKSDRAFFLQEKLLSDENTVEALAALKDSVQMNILCNFGEIVKTMEDNTSLGDNKKDMAGSQKMLLLQLCVNNLPSNSLASNHGPVGKDEEPLACSRNESTT